MKICIYGAASELIDKEYMTKVEAFGKLMAEKGHSLVFGGGSEGLMGAAARGVHNNGGKILGVIPHFFIEQSAEILYSKCDEVIKTDTMRERKQTMEENADAFVVVPGGIGTYEEFFEILTSKQLCRHNKPIAIYNISGYYDNMETMLKNGMSKGFIKEACSSLYKISDNPEEIFKYIETPINGVGSISEFKR